MGRRILAFGMLLVPCLFLGLWAREAAVPAAGNAVVPVSADNWRL